MKMTLEAKLICRELLKLSVEHGFGCGFDLAEIAEKLGIEGELYNGETESGILWGLGKNIGEEGLIDIDHDGDSAAVIWDMHGMVEARSYLTPEDRKILSENTEIAHSEQTTND